MIEQIKFRPALARYGLDNALLVVVDAGLQFYQDWHNPRLPFGRKIERALVAGCRVVGGAIVAAIIAPEATIPFLMVGVLFGIAIESLVTNIFNGLIFPELPWNLHPLTALD